MCILSLPFNLFFCCFAVTFSSHSHITPIHHYFTNFLCHFSVFLIYLALFYSSLLLFRPFKPVLSIFFCLVIFHSPYYLYFGCLLRISMISPPLFLLSLSLLRLVFAFFSCVFPSLCPHSLCCSCPRGASEEQRTRGRGGVDQCRERGDARGEDLGGGDGRGAEDGASCRWKFRRQLGEYSWWEVSTPQV